MMISSKRSANKVIISYNKLHADPKQGKHKIQSVECGNLHKYPVAISYNKLNAWPQAR